MPKHQPIETIARGLARSGSRVLLCRSKKHGYCYLPGGHIEFGEPARDALARELQEEAGLDIAVGALLLTEEQVFNQRGKNRHELTLIFEIPGLSTGAPLPDPVVSAEDHIEFVWLDLGAIADTVIYPESTRAWLASGGGVDPAGGPYLASVSART